MNSRQYRITKIHGRWICVVTYGLADTRMVGTSFDKRVHARNAALKHAELSGWKAIILY